MKRSGLWRSPPAMVMYAASREFAGHFWCCSRVVRHRFEMIGLSVLANFFSRFLGWTVMR